MEKPIRSAESFVIDIPKPRSFGKRYSVCTKQNIKYRPKKQERCPRKPSDISSTNYSSLDQKAVPACVLKSQDLLLSYREFLRIQRTQQHKTKLNIKLLDKYKIQYSNLRRRLYVEEPPNDVVGLKDLDEDFFSFVDGRPLPHNHVPQFKSLMFQYDKYIRNKIEVGYRNDAALNIDALQKLEREQYTLALNRCAAQVKRFDEFISNDYHNSIAMLSKGEKLAFQVEMQKAVLYHLAEEKFFIESKLVGLDYMYRRLQKHGRFLYYLSPPSWRAQNRDFAHSVEIEATGFEYGTSKDDDTFTIMFENIQREYLCNIVKPALYFQKPEDLMKVFETIEKQIANHFDYVTHMAPHTQMLHDSIKVLRGLIAQETATTATAVEDFKNLIDFKQIRGDQLEAKFFKILHGLFYECVGIPDVLKLRLHLEFCYEKVYEETPISMDIYSLARALESYYMSYSQELDDLLSDKVKKAVKQYEESERLKFKRSKEATRELRLFERLHHELEISFAPLPDKSQAQPRPKWSSLKRKAKKKPKVMVERRHLTDAEEDYLRFFTEWCSDEDPAMYLRKFSSNSNECSNKPIEDDFLI